MSNKRSNLVDMGRITSVYGVKGWVKVQSNTQPLENILAYQPWWLKTKHGVKPVEVEEARLHGQGLVVHLAGVDDRDVAQGYCRVNIAVERDQLPDLEDGDYYWHQLEGLQVVSTFEGTDYVFGEVKHMLETGANDVLVVKATADSLDDRERLVPYVPGQYVQKVDLDAGQILVSWDPEF